MPGYMVTTRNAHGKPLHIVSPYHCRGEGPQLQLHRHAPHKRQVDRTRRTVRSRMRRAPARQRNIRTHVASRHLINQPDAGACQLRHRTVGEHRVRAWECHTHPTTTT